MNKTPPATLNDVCETIYDLRKTLAEGLGTNFADMTPLQGIAISLQSIDESLNSIVCALERIADAQEKARTV